MKLYKVLFLLTLLFFTFNSNVKAGALSSPSASFVKYDLSYPGILPDNPLYKFKVLRDKIISFLISDPRKKAEFYLLETDKGILASAILVDKKEYKLAGEEALRAENNYTLLVGQLFRLSEKPELSFFNKLKMASLKHQEVILSLIKRVPPENQKPFENVLYFSKKNLQTVEEYRIKQ